jgi:hypothetical protein
MILSVSAYQVGGITAVLANNHHKLSLTLRLIFSSELLSFLCPHSTIFLMMVDICHEMFLESTVKDVLSRCQLSFHLSYYDNKCQQIRTRVSMSLAW